MSTFVLTGTFTAEYSLTESKAHDICTYFATFLRSKQCITAYEVWAGFRRRDGAWRFLVALPAAGRHLQDLTILNEVQDLFEGFVGRESCQTRWVDALRDPYCWDVQGWVDWGVGEDNSDEEEEDEDDTGTEKMEFVTKLSRNRLLGDVF
ncbi:hypothetical protein BJX64DRAFT_287363 [Aspergillus heterothallicus]